MAPLTVVPAPNPWLKAGESALITGGVAATTAAISLFTPLLHNAWQIAAVTAVGTALIRFLQGLQQAG
jgi:hypothetical protein